MLDTECTQQEQGAGRMVRTVVLLPPAERERLEEISEETGAPVSAIVRRSVTQYLSAKGQQS